MQPGYLKPTTAYIDTAISETGNTNHKSYTSAVGHLYFLDTVNSMFSMCAGTLLDL